MATFTPHPRTVARLSTVALWAVGSAYLLKAELANTAPDPVVLCATPVVWAVVLALPVLSTFARRDGQFLAMGLLWVAAICGSAYMLQATLGRQAEGRDMRMERAQQVNAERVRISRDLEDAKAMLAKAQRKCGEGRHCLPATRATIGVYQGAVAGHEHRLSKLPVSAPAAGEQRIAWLVAMVSGNDLDIVTETVGIVLPALLGLVIELSALALAMYGWHPAKVSRVAKAATVSTDAPPPRTRKPSPANVVDFHRHPVVKALETAGRPVNNDELARLMGVTKGEASKRWREVADRLDTRRVGRELKIALR